MTLVKAKVKCNLSNFCRNKSYQNETMNKLIPEVCSTVVGGEYDLYLALRLAQLRVECNAVLTRQVTILLNQMILDN